MAKVTSKLQVTVPKAIADRFGIRPGDQIEWTAAGEQIRVVPVKRVSPARTIPERLMLFDRATGRQRRRNRSRPKTRRGGNRGWTREDLYARGRSG